MPTPWVREFARLLAAAQRARITEMDARRVDSPVYRLPEPTVGEQVYVVVRSFHWEFGLGMAIAAHAGDVTSDARIVRRFLHQFRPLTGDAA